MPKERRSESRAILKQIASDPTLADFDFLLWSRDEADLKVRAVLQGAGHPEMREGGWILTGTTGEQLARGVGLPEAGSIRKALEAAGVQPPGLVLRPFVLANPDHLPGRLALIQFLARRATRLLGPASASAPSEAEDQLANKELAIQVRAFINTPYWDARAGDLAQALAPLGMGEGLSPLLVEALRSSRARVMDACRRNPFNWGAVRLQVQLSRALKLPLGISDLYPKDARFPMGAFSSGFPEFLPAMVLQEARQTGRWTEASDTLVLFLEAGIRAQLRNTFPQGGFSKRQSIESRAAWAWGKFGLPCVEALLRSNQEGEVLALLDSLEEGWEKAQPYESTAALAKTLGKARFAETLRALPRSPGKRLPPWLIREYPILLADPDRITEAYKVADLLAAEGVLIHVQGVVKDWEAFLSWNAPPKAWVLADTKGGIAGSGYEWKSPKETAHSILALGLRSTRKDAETYLRLHPGDPHALLQKARACIEEAQGFHQAHLGQPAAPKGVYQARLEEAFGALDALLEQEALSESFCVWMRIGLRDAGGIEGLRGQRDALCDKALKCLESRLQALPEEVWAWQAWAFLRARRLDPIVPRAMTQGEVRTLGLGPYPPPGAWVALYEEAVEQRRWEDIPAWLLPILNTDLDSAQAQPPSWFKDPRVQERFQQGIPLLVSSMLKAGKAEALSGFLVRCSALGVRGLRLAETKARVPEDQKTTFRTLLEALE